jgi:hypothetical protein
MWRVIMSPDARIEYAALPARERAAMNEAFQKLVAMGDQLGAPHTSSVQGTSVTLRELRPRRGSSPYRALYRRIEDKIVIGAIGPAAEHDRRGFHRAVEHAILRLKDYEEAGSTPQWRDHDQSSLT